MTVKGYSYGHAMHAHSLQTCEVCGKSITHAAQMSQDNTDYLVCGAFDCKKIMEQKASMPPALFESHVKFQRKLHEQRRIREARRKKRLTELTEKEDREHQQILRHAIGCYQVPSEKHLQLVVIPSGSTRRSPPPAERIKQYVKHLAGIITQATDCADIDGIDQKQHQDAHKKLALVDEWFDIHPEQRAMSDRLCTLCKGGCCHDGREHAYLSATTIQHYMERHPDLSGLQILEIYLSHLNEETITNSCINQTTTGCALPRELRSDICNAFYCDPLRSYQRKSLDSKEEDPVLAIQRARTLHRTPDPDVVNDVVNVALLNESHTHKVTIP